MDSHRVLLHGPLPQIETMLLFPLTFTQRHLVRRGDLMQVTVKTEGVVTGIFPRQVVSVSENAEGCTVVILAPLDMPLMRQVEVRLGDGTPKVLWVACAEPIEPGTLLGDVFDNDPIEVLRSFTSLPILDVPEGAYSAAAMHTNQSVLTTTAVNELTA